MADDDWADDNPTNDDFENESQDSYGSGAASKKKMNTSTKVILWVLGIAGVFALICCGGVVYFIGKFQKALIQDPDQIAAMTQEIIEIEISEQFTPAGAMDMSNLPIPNMPGAMKFAVYTTADQNGMLMLGQIQVSDKEANKFQAEQQQKQMQEAMRQQGGQQRQLEIAETETREFEIREQKVDFQFAKGTDRSSGTEYRQVNAIFTIGKDLIFFMVQVPEEDYDEAAIEKMIRSMK